MGIKGGWEGGGEEKGMVIMGVGEGGGGGCEGVRGRGGGAYGAGEKTLVEKFRAYNAMVQDDSQIRAKS